MARKHTRRADHGYALISALWLLLLAASLSGLLMLRSVRSSAALVEDRTAMQDQNRIESALETAMADMLFYGNASVIARGGGTGRYVVDGKDVIVRASAESTRVDLNTAPLSVIDETLASRAIAPEIRATLLGILTERRANAAPLASLSEWRALLRHAADHEGGDALCALDMFTTAGGRTTAAPPANAINNTDPYAGAGVSGSVANAASGGVMRLTATLNSRAITIIAFPSASGTEPMAVMDRMTSSRCPS